MSPFVAPIEVEIIASGMPALALGIDDDQALVVLEDGTFGWLAITALRTSWRFHWATGEWVDLKEIDGTQDIAPDGGESISGSVPELDDIGESDPVDEEGRQTPGDPGHVDSGEDR